VLIKPLSYPKAGELVSIKQVAPGLNVSELRLSATQYFTYRDEGRVFQQIGLYGDGGRTITGVGDPEQARALFLTYDVLQALAVKATTRSHLHRGGQHTWRGADSLR
jgi:hypothetical protein